MGVDSKRRPLALRGSSFVRAAHSGLPQTRKLLGADSTLINATWDWGGGDFETALGGASHMGRPDIALFLLEHGARLDLFAATMLGLTPVVKSALEKYPAFLNTPGPHGIPLLAHAKAGGEPAKEVREYLEGLAGQKTPAQPT
ncbi:MAG: ankyrin repeat domain-containing protein [Verrucomicrobiota bacterium]|nr:ankyrin repeat domain-containing protein [Verrucomicrobiota bacterium]